MRQGYVATRQMKQIRDAQTDWFIHKKKPATMLTDFRCKQITEAKQTHYLT